MTRRKERREVNECSCSYCTNFDTCFPFVDESRTLTEFF